MTRAQLEAMHCHGDERECRGESYCACQCARCKEAWTVGYIEPVEPERDPLPPPLLLVHDSGDCLHQFVDSKTCLRCGKHCSDLKLEEDAAGLALLGDLEEPSSVERARVILRFVERFGAPRSPGAQGKLEALRERVRKAEQC